MPSINEIKAKTFYEILNVSPDASVEVIKESYKEIAKIYHPDSNYYAEIISEPLTPEQEEIFKIITAAYNTLITPDKRSAYDNLMVNNLKGWDEEDEFWDHKKRPAEQLKSKVGAPTAKTTTVNLKTFGRITPRSVQVEEAEEIEEYEEETFFQKYSLWIVGFLFICTGAGLLIILFK